ncbi:MAG: MFS transporter [Lactobacillus sp.]
MSKNQKAHKQNKLMADLGFDDGHQLGGFLTVVASGQLVYSGFEAFKSVFYKVLLQVLHLNNTQLGIIFSLIGISVFFYIPGGWFNNRFSVKSILITGLTIRLLTMFIVIFGNPSFTVMRIIATIWGLTDAVFWPAVLNGVDMMSNPGHKGLAYGLLESLRRGLEMIMNLALVGVMSLISGLAVFKGGMLVYNLLIIPLIFCIVKFVPSNGIADDKKAEADAKAKDAFKGLLKILTIPKLWLAAVTALTIYWSYINVVYAVPYLQTVFHMGQTQASIFGVLNTGATGVVASALSGILADYVFHSTSKMMFASLCLVFISIVAVLLLPKTPSMLWPSIILLLIFSFTMFLAKGVFMAPISEAGVPKKYTGAAMSLGSFMGYAPDLWGYGMNGFIIDHNSPLKAYSLIFLIGAIVTLMGIVCSFVLMMTNKKQDQAKKQAAKN